MSKIYHIKCNKHIKFKNHKISYIFYITSVISIIYDKWESKDESLFRAEESVKISKVFLV